MNGIGLDQYLQLEIATLLFVFLRVLGLMLFCPIYSSPALAMPIRFYLVMAISFAVVGIVAPPRAQASTMLDVGVLAAAELVIGLVLGAFVQFVFAALQLAGQTVGLQLGLALANVVNPQFDDQTSTTAVVYATTASMIFLATGLDREVFRAVLESFGAIPLGGVFVGDSLWGFMATVFQQSMILAIRVAAPVTLALFLAEIAMGFVGRTVPQLNVLSIGFSIRILLGLVIMMVGLSEVGRGFFDSTGQAIVEGYKALATLAP